MLHKLSILIALALVSCSQPTERHQKPAQSDAVTEAVSLPAGFTIIEQQPDGYFVRLASAERASSGTIRELAVELTDKFDRVDLCLDVAHERGDEYASIIRNQVFDTRTITSTPFNDYGYFASDAVCLWPPHTNGVSCKCSPLDRLLRHN